jgi:hypothetical protein
MKRLIGPALAALAMVAGSLAATALPAQAAAVAVAKSCADVATPGVMR